jgi:cytoskeleton protein RodZ
MEGHKDTALGLGERLRSARKARALTLDQAASALHLEPAILVALEEERFTALGAPVFVRGHLRAYARLLEMSEEAVLEAYRSADPSSRELPRVARKLEAPVRQSPGPWVIAAFIVLLLFAVVLTYVAQDKAPPTEPVLIDPLENVPARPVPSPFVPAPGTLSPPTGAESPAVQPGPGEGAVLPAPEPAPEPAPAATPEVPADPSLPGETVQ